MSWSTLLIGDLGRVITGKTPPTKQRQYFNGEYPFITPSDLEYDSFRVTATTATVSNEAKLKFANQFLPANAITFTCIASVGKIGVTSTESLTNQQINSIIVNNLHDWRFVYYLLRNEARRIQGMCSGVATPIINKRDFEKVKVTVPNNLATQKSIASILSAYDDLIENNRRRIQLLEQSAQLLYKEWFIYLRFPGHEHVTITDGVPEGWIKKPLSTLCTDIRNSIHPKTLAPDFPYIGLEHIPRHSITLDSWGKTAAVNSNKFRFSKGDILFGKIRPYFHKVGFALVDGITSSDAIVIRPTEDRLYFYVLSLLSSNEFVALASKTVREGSKMPRADWKFLLKSEFKVPSKALLDFFNETMDPICSQLRTLALHNRKLAHSRDLLLPRLMNGEIAV